MRVVILAGGLGTRLQEETETRPKPMVEIGGRPILWHIMKLYGAFDLSHFVVALGYKGEIIKSYFLNYRNLSSDLSIDIATGTSTTARRHRGRLDGGPHRYRRADQHRRARAQAGSEPT